MTCECGKRRYLTRDDAKRAVRAFEGDRSRKLRAYRCPGGFWHLTSASADHTAFLRRTPEGLMSILTALFGWPGTWGAGGNMVAWVICGCIGFGWSHRKEKARHAEQIQHAEQHHEALKAHVEGILSDVHESLASKIEERR